MTNYHDWSCYYPDEVQSREYETYIDAAALKIHDVYTAFCYFDCSIKFYEADEYGKISEGLNEENKLFVKSKFLFDALFYSNCCRDYIQQMLHCFCQNHSEEKFDHEKLEKDLENSALSELVNEELEKLIALSNGINKKKMNQILALKKEIETLFSDEKDKGYSISKKCNYIKHRGMFSIKGTEANNKTAFEDIDLKVKFIPVNGTPIQCAPKKQMYREEFDTEKEYTDLLRFRTGFIEKFDELIKLVMPPDYIKPKGGFLDIQKQFDGLSEISVGEISTSES